MGITKYRDGLCPLTTFNKETAGETIDIIEEFQRDLLEKYGTRTVFPSDEFFLTADRPLPSAEYYEDYPQYENGVGMLRSLIDEFDDALDTAEWEGDERRISIVTGRAPFKIISDLVRKAEEKFPKLKCGVYPIRNDFFGETITVTGLITAQDLIAQMKNKKLGDELLISSAMLMHGSDIFLDDLTVGDVERELNVRVRAVQNDGYELLDAVMGI